MRARPFPGGRDRRSRPVTSAPLAGRSLSHDASTAVRDATWLAEDLGPGLRGKLLPVSVFIETFDYTSLFVVAFLTAQAILGIVSGKDFWSGEDPRVWVPLACLDHRALARGSGVGEQVRGAAKDQGAQEAPGRSAERLISPVACGLAVRWLADAVPKGVDCPPSV